MRASHIRKFGAKPLDNVRDKQAWFMAKLRRSVREERARYASDDGRPTGRPQMPLDDTGFTHAYTVGCYRLAAHSTDKIRSLLLDLPSINL